MRFERAKYLAVILVLASVGPLSAQSLRGSRNSLDQQNRIARAHDFTWIRTTSQMRRFAEAGYLVRIRSNPDYEVKWASRAYTRPEVALFLERLGRQYRETCGERLVVTSLTRPSTRQPRNASPRSVHPTGMAVDLRRPWKRSCRGWLEAVLLQLEGAGVLEATRESRPPHYHVAVFPRQYAAYVQSRLESRLAAATPGVYRVQSGDSLWVIARRTGTSVRQLVAANGLTGNRIYAGQVLNVPVTP